MLAAGRGVRFGGEVPKQLVPLAGRPLAAYAVDAALASGCSPVVVVVSDDRVEAALHATGAVTFVHNDAPERGISSSLQSALCALEPDDEVDAVVVGLADQPLVGPDAYRRIAHAYDDGARLAVAVYDGTQDINHNGIADDHGAGILAWDDNGTGVTSVLMLTGVTTLAANDLALPPPPPPPPPLA